MSKLSHKWEPFIFVGIMAFGMSAILSFIILVINIGFVEHFLSIWFSSWMQAFFIALVPAFMMRKFAIIVLSKIIQR
jgi:hypothetical protein